MKLTVIDGQGGKTGKSVIERLKKQYPNLEIYTIRTNSVATSAMLRTGTDYGATGRNPAIVNAEDSDIIIGPIGAVFANSLFGEIIPATATAVGASKTFKILIPVNRCGHFVVGREDAGPGEYIRIVCEKVDEMAKEILRSPLLQKWKMVNESGSWYSVD